MFTQQSLYDKSATLTFHITLSILAFQRELYGNVNIQSFGFVLFFDQHLLILQKRLLYKNKLSFSIQSFSKENFVFVFISIIGDSALNK